MPFEDFKVDDRVHHETLGDGTVLSAGDSICVVYDKTGPGSRTRGRYDRRWFQMFPGVLTRAPSADGGDR